MYDNQWVGAVPTQLTQFILSRLMGEKMITTSSQTKHHLPLLIQQIFSESTSCSVVSDSLQPHGLYSPWNSPGLNTGVGSFSLLQGIFPTQGSNSGLSHSRWILLPAEPQGKPKNTGVGSLSLLQEIFPIQESNWGLLHCRWILYQLSYEGSKCFLITI